MLQVLHAVVWLIGIPAFCVLLVGMAFKGRDAIWYYNIYQREHERAELSDGYFSSRESGQHLLFCHLPEDMSRNIRGFIISYRVWTALFFANLIVLLVASH